MRLACWRARPRDRELSSGAAVLTRCRFKQRSYRRAAETNRQTRVLPRICCRGRHTLCFRQITSPQLFRVWQFVEITQTEMIEEKLRRFVKKRPSRDFGASSDFHEPTLH